MQYLTGKNNSHKIHTKLHIYINDVISRHWKAENVAKRRLNDERSRSEFTKGNIKGVKMQARR